MTDAPERIWANPDHWLEHAPEDFRPRPEEYVEYLRADLVPDWSNDMDAAPKDGTRVLAYWPDVYGNGSATQVESWFGPRQASWEDACWQSAFEWDDGSNSPTHWMPLPAPPKEGE